MTGAFKFHASEWLTGGAHFLILAFALEADDPAVWPYALAAMSIISFFAWIATYKRYRTIHDLPTSRVASAAQGYVELFGRSELLPGHPVASRLTGLPCCWYRYYTERKTANDKWEHVDSGISNEHFLLVDASGECVISPEGAEVLSDRKQTWTEGDYRHTEWLLLTKGTLYAIGEFSTASGNITAQDERADVSELLGEWKKDRTRLLERFDLNRDGDIDIKEWELARLEAQREVRQRHSEGRAAVTEGVHLLRKPRDGRLFLLANALPDKLGRRFALWSWLHLLVFFSAGAISLLLFL
jgi:hypothetical protein